MKVKNRDKDKSRKKGFTLVELIVVIVIILVLAAVLVPTVLKYINKAKEAAAIEECAGVVRAAANERTQWLAEGGTEPSEEDIVAAAGAGGTITSIEYSPDDYDVIKMTYLSSNGLTVHFQRDHDPQYWIEGKETSSPTSIADSWIKKATEIMGQLPGNNMQDIEVIAKIREENGGKLPSVDPSFLEGTKYTSADDLRWFPHHIGSKASGDYGTILYANQDSGSGHAGWKAKLVYVDGKIYQPVNGTEILINSIQEAGTDPEKVKEWLIEKGFEEVKK